jgi:hypothetical protein
MDGTQPASTFQAFIGKWPTRSALCADIGVTPQGLNNMRIRNSVPSRYWPAMVAGAERRNIEGVTLATLAAAQRSKLATNPKSSSFFTLTVTEDGTCIAFDPATGRSASGMTADEAIAELRRLLSIGEAA